MQIRTRAQAGLAPPRSRRAIPTPTPRLWLHHTAGVHATSSTAARTLRAIQSFHIGGRGWQDIAYSFLTDNDGGAWTGRGAGIAGGHTAGDNTRSHAICAMGNYEVRQPPQALLTGIANLTRTGAARGWWPNQITGGHRQAPGASTACPGRFLQAQIPEINRRARSTATVPPPPRPVPPKRSDMTPDQVQSAVRQAIRQENVASQPAIVLDSRTGINWVIDGFSRSALPKGQPVVDFLTILGQSMHRGQIVNGNTKAWHDWLDLIPEAQERPLPEIVRGPDKLMWVFDPVALTKRPFHHGANSAERLEAVNALVFSGAIVRPSGPGRNWGDKVRQVPQNWLDAVPRVP